MKKLIYTLLAFATVCFSCVQDVDDVYDKPVAQRVDRQPHRSVVTQILVCRLSAAET